MGIVQKIVDTSLVLAEDTLLKAFRPQGTTSPKQRELDEIYVKEIFCQLLDYTLYKIDYENSFFLSMFILFLLSLTYWIKIAGVIYLFLFLLQLHIFLLD